MALRRMVLRHMARALSLLAWVTSTLRSYGCTSYGASILAFGLGQLILLPYGCTQYGTSIIASGLGYLNFAIVLRLAWVTSSLLWYGCTSYGARIIAFGLGQLVFVIIWLYLVWCKYDFLWPGLPHLCHRMAVHRMA